jgi:signal transduction histidine kinase
VVAGHAQLLGAFHTDDQIQHHVKEILGAVDRLTQLSTDVLDYAKVREPNRESVDMGGFLKQLAEPLLPRAQDAGIALVCAGPPCTASLDRHRFARVVENLLANSMDALGGGSGGTIEVTWAYAATGGVALTVKDNGKGIPRKVIKRIFEPFYSHGKARGTGLGMATVKKIVEEHGGTIDVQSEEGQGTTVTLLLPDPAGDRLDDSTGRIKIADLRLG